MILYKAGCLKCGRMVEEDGSECSTGQAQKELQNGCSNCGGDMKFIYSGYGEELFLKMRAQVVESETRP